MDIENIQDNWDDEMDVINKNIYQKAVENGITKADYFNNYKFDLFEIVDMKDDKDRNIQHHHC